MYATRAFGLVLAAGLLVSTGPASGQTPLGTAFTYQGRLTWDGEAVSGPCDFQFSLWDEPSDGNQMPVTVTLEVEELPGGLFTVQLDFGENVFQGNARWLEMSVCCPSPCTPEVLSPRQELTPAPHALALPGLRTQQNMISPNLLGGYAGNVINDTVVGGTISGGGASEADPAAGTCDADPSILCQDDEDCVINNGRCVSEIIGGRCSDDPAIFCLTDEDCVAGTCQPDASVGTCSETFETWCDEDGDCPAEEICVPGQIPGTCSDDPAIACLTDVDCPSGTCEEPQVPGTCADDPLIVCLVDDDCVIDNGPCNPNADVGRCGGDPGTLCLTDDDCVLDEGPCVPDENLGVCLEDPFVYCDLIPDSCPPEIGPCVVVPPWIGRCSQNPEIICWDDSDCLTRDTGTCEPFATTNVVVADHGSVGGGMGNTAGGEELGTPPGAYATVGGGRDNTASGKYSTVSGGRSNTASGKYSAIGGGYSNEAKSYAATIAGGYDSEVAGTYGTVGGGRENKASGDYSTVSGGERNKASKHSATVGGGRYNTASGDESTVGGGASNVVGAYDGGAILGGYSNSVFGYWSTVGGGWDNGVDDHYSAILGGESNSVFGHHSTVGGGRDNGVDDYYSAILGGYSNNVDAEYSAILGGLYNYVDGDYSAILGGGFNGVSGEHSAIVGGAGSSNSGDHSVVVGGSGNSISASADYSMAFGNNVGVTSSYRVALFSDDYPGCLGINRDSTINRRIHVGTNTSNGNGAYLTNGGVWTDGSSRECKTNFQTLERKDLMSRIRGLPVEAWEYEGTGERHIFPCAEDFQDSFDVGVLKEDGTRERQYLAAMDVAGVALAGVKALDEMIKEKDARIAELEARLAALERAVGLDDHRARGADSAGLGGATITAALALLGLTGFIMRAHSRRGGVR